MATDVAYLKALRPLYQRVSSVFCYRDETFPKDPVTGGPDRNIIGRVNSSIAELADFYRGSEKRTVGDTFRAKVGAIPVVAVVPKLVELVAARRAELPGALAGEAGPLNVSARSVPGKRTNVQVRLWRRRLAKSCF